MKNFTFFELNYLFGIFDIIGVLFNFFYIIYIDFTVYLWWFSMLFIYFHL